MTARHNKVTVHIFGQLYNIKGDQDPERIRRVARLVHEQMRKVAAANTTLSPSQIAVLAALNIAEEHLQLEDDYKHIMAFLQNDKG